MILHTHHRERQPERVEAAVWMDDLHEHSRNDDSLDSTTQDWIGDDGERLVDDHVGHEKCDEEQMAVLANWDYLLGLGALLGRSSAREYFQRRHVQREVTKRQSS